MTFHDPLPLDGLTLPNRALLAPLAGVTDVPFRRICTEMGAGLTWVEMLSATAILHGNDQTREMMARHASETVLGVQVTGKTVVETARAVELLDREGFDTIDINMGCPVRKVVGSGMGSAFLLDGDRISDTVRACVEATSRPVTVKCRIGYTRDNINIRDTAQRVASAGARMFTVHGRTRGCTYADPVDHASILAGFDTARSVNPRIVCVGNGNVLGHETASRMQADTGCDAVMISRGALGNPWIFREILEGRPVHPEIGEWSDVVLRHIEYHRDHYGNDPFSARRLRKHLLWYVKGFADSAKLRGRINTMDCLEEAADAIRRFAGRFPRDARRYEDAARPSDTSYDPKYEMDRKLDRGVAGREDADASSRAA